MSSVPIIFTKAPTGVIASGEAIDSTLDPTSTVNYEGELAAVIGGGGRGIAMRLPTSHSWRWSPR
jgi:2-keto-4-pentenoate hydratase/2-oxohepta-3-ene-1,7-dioic acid hydratase in catechol pathway